MRIDLYAADGRYEGVAELPDPLPPLLTCRGEVYARAGERTYRRLPAARLVEAEVRPGHVVVDRAEPAR